MHYFASFYGCDDEALTSISELRDALHTAVVTSGMTTLGEVDHVFPGDGLTVVILLAESHASIHTYPEYNACFVDLFTCGDGGDRALFESVLADYLQPESIEHQTIVRGNV